MPSTKFKNYGILDMQHKTMNTPIQKILMPISPYLPVANAMPYWEVEMAITIIIIIEAELG